MTTAPTAQDQGHGTAATAGDEGKHLGGVAAEEAQSVAGDAKQQAQRFLDDAMQQINEQSSVQRDRLVELLRAFSRDLREMASHANSASLAGQLAHEGADRAEDAGSILDGREPADLVDDVRAFARRRPGAFLAGSLLAGVVVGRFARGAKDAKGGADLPSLNETDDARAVPVPRPVTGPLDGPGAPVTPATTTAEASPLPEHAGSTVDPASGGPYTDTR